MTSQRQHADRARPHARPTKSPRTDSSAGVGGRQGAAGAADIRGARRRSPHQEPAPARPRSTSKPAMMDTASGRADGKLPTSPVTASSRQARDDEVIVFMVHRCTQMPSLSAGHLTQPRGGSPTRPSRPPRAVPQSAPPPTMTTPDGRTTTPCAILRPAAHHPSGWPRSPAPAPCQRLSPLGTPRPSWPT